MMVLLLALLAQTVPADQDSLTLESLRREAASSLLQDDPGAASAMRARMLIDGLARSGGDR